MLKKITFANSRGGQKSYNIRLNAKIKDILDLKSGVFFCLKNIKIYLLLLVFVPFSVVIASNLESGSDSLNFVTGLTNEYTGDIQNGLQGNRGVRMKIVDASGRQLFGTRTLNVQFDEQFEGKYHQMTNGVYAYMYADGTCSKIDYIKGVGNCQKSNRNTSSVNADSIMSISTFLSMSDKLHYSSNKADFSYMALDFNISKLFNYFTKGSYTSRYKGTTDEQYRDEVLNAIFDLFQVDKAQWDAHIDNYKYGTYIIIEPTMTIKYNGAPYWGTAYELAQLNYSGKNSLSYVLNYVAPCSSVLTGGTIASNPLAEGVNKENKTYFDVLTYFTNDEAASYCHNGGFDKSTAEGEYGVGTKLLWLGELFENNCQIMGDAIYNGKMIKDMTISEYMDYGDVEIELDEKTKFKISKYFMACTCHGLEEYYYQDTGQKLENLSTDKILNIFNAGLADRHRNWIKLKFKDEKIENYRQWDYDNYIKECPNGIGQPDNPDEPKGPDCTPQFGGANEGNPGSCYGDQLFYKDSNEWNDCIFNDNGYYTTTNDKHKLSNTTNSLTYYDDSIGNSSYCKVYCVEELNASISTYIPTVAAGQNFVWNGHLIKGSRTCKTKTIEYDKFIKELDAANRKTLNDYVDWQLDIKKAESIENPTPIESDTSAGNGCDCINNIGGECCIEFGPSNCVCGNAKSDSMNCGEDGKSACGDSEPDSMDCYCGCGKHDYKRYTRYNAAGVNFSATSPVYGTVSNSWGGTWWCAGGSNSNKPQVYPSSSKYINSLNYANSLVQNMKSCYNEGTNKNWTTNLYNVDPKATIDRTGDANQNYNYNGELNAVTNYTNILSSLDCTSDTQPLITSCSGKNCSITNQDMKKCKTVEMTKQATTSFVLDDSVFRCVDKLSGQSYHYKNNGYGCGNVNYIDIKYGNFPVSNKTNPGTIDNGLTLKYNNLGHIKNGSSIVDNIIHSLVGSNKGDPYTYVCPYIVSNGLLPDPIIPKGPGGVIVIYRPIDLYNPFPSIDGDGRNTGWNWGDEYGINNTNETVQKVILNNRGVKGDDIYKLEPMYSFTLTPAVIKSIIQFNRSNDYNSTDININGKVSKSLDCDKGNGQRCISSYLTELIQLTGATGVCTQDRKSSFDTCRYKR